MSLKVKAKLVKIGNSRGVRLPKALIEQAGLSEDIELIARDGEIILANQRRPREGWAEAMAKLTPEELALTDEDLAWINMRPLPEEEVDWEWE